MPWSHAHADLELNFTYSGNPRYSLRDGVVELPEGRFAAFWAAAPHRLIPHEPETRFMWLHIPLTLLLRWNLKPGFLTRVFTGELIVDEAALPWDPEMTRRWLRDLASHNPELIRAVELEVEARVRRFCCADAEPNSADPSNEQHGRRLAIMTSYLMQHYLEDLSASEVAESAGINKHYAMRLFRREYGFSIWQYVLYLRIAHAQNLLLATDIPVISVGLESGFGSTSRFYDIFTRECKVSPAEFRRQALGRGEQ